MATVYLLRKKIKKGEKIEECYVLISKRGGDKGLEDFYFDAKGKKRYAVFLGYGSIYNHADDANADYTINVTKRIATIKAAENIPKGKEIFVSYGEEWFESRGLKAKKNSKVILNGSNLLKKVVMGFCFLQTLKNREVFLELCIHACLQTKTHNHLL